MAGGGLEPPTHGISVLGNARNPLENQGFPSKAQQKSQQQDAAQTGSRPDKELAALVDLFSQADIGKRAAILEAVRNIVGNSNE